jgi:hypothetical protein
MVRGTLHESIISNHSTRSELTALCSEATAKSGAAIVKKTWAERLNDQPELESDCDEQLLMHIP